MAVAEKKMTLLPWLIFVYLVIFPFGQLGRIELTSNIIVHAVDLVAGLIGLFWVVRFTRRRLARLKVPKLGRPFLSFLAVAAFTLLLGAIRVVPNEALAGFFYLLRFTAYVLLYFAVRDVVARKKELKHTLVNALLTVGSFVAVFGWIQYLAFPSLVPLSEYGWDPHYFRLVGTFLDSGFTGILLALFTLLIFTKIWSGGAKAGDWALLFLGISSLALTYSRASYLAFFAGLVILYIVRRNLKLLVGGLVLLAIAVFLLPRPAGEGVRLERTSTVNSRLESYKEAVAIVKNNPLFGVGFNLYRAVNEDESKLSHAGAGTHSSLLFVLATTGIAGFATFSWLLWQIAHFLWLRRNKVNGMLVVASFWAIFIHSFFDNSLFYPWVLGQFAILLGTLED